MSAKKKEEQCPWCGNRTDDFAKQKRAWGKKLTKPEIAELGDKVNEPLQGYALFLLLQMWGGTEIYDQGGHPWINGGGTVSRYSTHLLGYFGYAERKHACFSARGTSQEHGSAWSITDKGKKLASDIVHKSKNFNMDAICS